MSISEKTLADLGWAEVQKGLGERCRTEPGKARALCRPFLESAAEVKAALTLVAEARRLREEPLLLPLTGVAELRPSLERAEKGALLEPRELVAVTHALFSFERVREALDQRAQALPALAAVGRRVPLLEALATRLDRSFEASGELSDRASPELREVRDRTRGLHRSIKARLEGLLRDEKFTTNLREGYFSVRNDRYVLPVLAQFRAEVPGIVHNASQSGQTLFVEPQELIGLGNDLAIAQSLVLEQERRVLQELSEAVGRVAGSIAEGVEACAALDEAEGAAKLALDLEAQAPELEAADGPLVLEGLRHPLLVARGHEVVANDVRLSGQSRAMVVSGPNAGGKTVTLTAVGLCALMLRAGLPVTASAGSQVPLFRSVHSVVGDAQDLEKGLSTFSAHVARLKEIAEAATGDSLVLIDEIAADTDPREGAAIAIAVLEDLLERGALVLVTTHLEELKALAHLDLRFVNARVGFDARRMAPTYRLQLGVSGTSSAIDIAARTELAEKICARARELAKNSGGPLAKAVAAAEQERRRLAEEADRAQADASAAHTTRESLDHERREFEARRIADEQRFREALEAELQFAQRQVRELLDRLKTQASQADLAAAERELAARVAGQDRALRAMREKRAEAEGPRGPADLRVGGRVHHRGLGQDVEILDLESDDAVVAAGALRTRAKLTQLGPARGAAPRSAFPKADKRPERLERAEAAAPRAAVTTGPTCDVRGLRAEDALRDVEHFLDRALRDGEDSAVVLHGHGTGALKTSIRSYLASSPYIQSFRPGEGHEGGDGVTVVRLRA